MPTNVLGPQLDSAVLAEIREMEAKEDYSNPRYNELIVSNYYPEHVLRMPLDDWPDPVNRAFANISQGLYATMQGPSEFGVVGDAKLKNWDIKDQLKNISVPTLSIGGKCTTLWILSMYTDCLLKFKTVRFLYCEKRNSHLCMYDDQKTFFDGIIKFINDVNGMAAFKILFFSKFVFIKLVLDLVLLKLERFNKKTHLLRKHSYSSEKAVFSGSSYFVH